MGQAELSIRLLGQFELRRAGDAVVPLDSARAESLLAFLLLHRDEPQQRQRVAFALWPDSTEAQALTNLRHVLHTLRRSVPAVERHLEVTARTLRWRADLPYRLDVADFEAALARESWVDAVDAYGGALLADRVDAWAEEDRARVRNGYLDALDRLVAALRERRDLAGAVRSAERLRREEPLREETYRILMRLHDERADRARAVRVYHECEAILERELGVEPAPATREAYDALLATDNEPTASRARLSGVPLVGRAAERAMLTAAWRAALKGRTQVVLLAGEAGVGKTRLAEEFRAWCAHRGAVTAVARAYREQGMLAYGPVVAWLRAEPVKEGLRGLPRPYLVELSRVMPELTAIPGMAVPERLPESDQRQRLFDAVTRGLLGRRDPVMLLADDVQWWDRETLRLLHYLLRATSAGPLIVVATVRREDVETSRPLADLLLSLRADGMLTEVELNRLDKAETAQLAEQAGGGRLTESAAEKLYARTEGNPLFVVEALRAGWPADADTLTPRVQAIIESRLAQLSAEARDLVDIAATVGREFTAEVLAAAGRIADPAVVHGLDELWRRRIIREHNATAYDFSHDKIRETAYQALSPMRRRWLHREVARALETSHAQDIDAVSAQLGAHHEGSGATEQAVDWYARAADVAQRLYAHGESSRLLTRAIGLVRTMPGSAARELALLTAVIAPLVAGEGYSSPRVRQTHERALELARSLGVEPAAPMLRSLALHALTAGDFAAAREFGKQLKARARRGADAVLLVEGEYVLGVTAFWAAEFERARTHLEHAVRLYRDEHRCEHLLSYAQDPKVVCLTRLACTYWFLGDPEAAVRARDEGLELAEEIGHPYSLTTGLLFAGMLAVDMADPQALREFLTRLNDMRTPDMGPQIWSAFEALRAYLDVVDGRPAEGVAAIRRVLADPRLAESAAPGLRSVLVRLLLAACDAAGESETGIAAADELLAMPGSRVWDHEATRLREKFLAARRPANA